MNTCDLVSYNILEVFLLVERGTVQLINRITLIQTPSSFFIMHKCGDGDVSERIGLA